jgi:Domain of unknown function (DU1801)
MAKAKAKTVETKNSVTDFINSVPDEKKKTDCFTLIEIMKEQSGFEPKLWGPSIVGFGSYHYIYESGREGDAPLVAFSPRKAEISLYLASNFENREELLQKFGKHKSAKACIYVKKLEDIDLAVLKKMITLSIKQVKRLHK